MKWWAIYTNFQVDVIVRLSHPRTGKSQGQETFLAPSADKQTRDYDIECSNRHLSLSTLRPKGLSRSKMKWWAIHANLPMDVIFRLPHPRIGYSQGQKTFLALSADKQTRNYDIECSNHHPLLSTVRPKGLGRRNMKSWVIYTNFPVDIILRLPHPPSADSQGQETSLAPSNDKPTRTYDIECSNHNPSLSTVRPKLLSHSKMKWWFINTKLPVDVIVRLPPPPSGDSQGKKKFLAPFFDKETRNYYRERSNYHPTLSTLRPKRLSHSKMKWWAVHANLPMDVIFRLPHPRSGHSHGQEKIFSTLCSQTNTKLWHRVLKSPSLTINPKAKRIEP